TVENDAALHLYYIVQEAVLNAAKHGKAAQIIISLARTGDRLVLTIQDDGSGFELSGNNSTGMGIRIMRYRARVIGATLDLKSRPGQGTQVICVFYSAPQKVRQEAEDAQKKSAANELLMKGREPISHE
ncbi:MAG TPA: ATP-binding protein, partial [Verrucomicrobiae bacterium]